MEKKNIVILGIVLVLIVAIIMVRNTNNNSIEYNEESEIYNVDYINAVSHDDEELN
jgi:lipopolysaccharide export system protein LptC